VDVLSELKRKLRSIWPHLDERTRRLTAANEAVSVGYGGVSLVHRACGLSRKAIAKGIREMSQRGAPLQGRIRRPGAGRKLMTVSDPLLVQALDEMIEGHTRGDPESPLRWICKSTRAIAEELGKQEHPVSHMKVAQILHDLDYSLQSNRKTEEGADHPDRDAQFQHISAQVKQYLRQSLPVPTDISTLWVRFQQI
jgi:Rhodopirellula transposase DDE domain